MVQHITSYRVKIQQVNYAFNETAAYLQSVTAYLIKAVDQCYDELFVTSDMTPKERNNYVERLVHHTKQNPSPFFDDFDDLFYKLPSYYRRHAIAKALGIVASYRSNLASWKKAGSVNQPPRLQVHHRVYPTLYRKDCYRELDNNNVAIKIRRNGDWVWLTVNLRASDVRYIQRHKSDCVKSAPTLVKKGRHYFLQYTFTKSIPLITETDRVTAVDLNLNTDAVLSVIHYSGTVCSRKFLRYTQEKDLLWTNLNRVKRNQQMGTRQNKKLYAIAKGINQQIAAQTARDIVDYAIESGSGVIVFEHLDFAKSIGGSQRQRMHHWRYKAIRAMTTAKAHAAGLRVSTVNAWNTSRLAFDGSGYVKRGRQMATTDEEPAPYSLVQFTTGKIYNADLNAVYNIGARYWIRHHMKSLPATVRLTVAAKVPQLLKRSTCTLSHLISLFSVAADFGSPLTGLGRMV